MIVGASWTVPVASRPIPRGAVLVRGTRIERVGRFDELVAELPDEPARMFEGCVLTPGLVNAHTHLSLTVLRDVVEPTRLAGWLKRVTLAIMAMHPEDFGASAALGAVESLESGVTVVGDIAYGVEAAAACVRAGVGGTFYWESLGIEAGALAADLERRRFAEGAELPAERVRRGLSPHTPYTAGPQLLRASYDTARAAGAAFAIHVAESRDERRLLADGSGPFAETAAHLAHGFRVPRASSVAYLGRLGVLDGALAVHCVHLDPGDAEMLAAMASGVALCPRSNALLHNGRPPLRDLVAAGAVVACGTDSAASNEDLDILAELRALRAIEPAIPAARLVRMVTLDGARALGVDDRFGSLEAGKQADLALFALPCDADPEEAVVARGGRDVLSAVMSAGEWRILDGAHTTRLESLYEAAGRAQDVAADAVRAG